MKTVRWAWPRARCQASATLSAVSTASLPELQNSTLLRSPGASAVMRSAASKERSLPLWKAVA